MPISKKISIIILALFILKGCGQLPSPNQKAVGPISVFIKDSSSNIMTLSNVSISLTCNEVTQTIKQPFSATESITFKTKQGENCTLNLDSFTLSTGDLFLPSRVASMGSSAVAGVYNNLSGALANVTPTFASTNSSLQPLLVGSRIDFTYQAQPVMQNQIDQTPKPVTLSSITLSSATSPVYPWQTSQFSALGTYSDGSSATLANSSLNWNSSNTGISTINSSGLATGVASGTSSITASLGGITSTLFSFIIALLPQSYYYAINIASSSGAGYACPINSASNALSSCTTMTNAAVGIPAHPRNIVVSPNSHYVYIVSLLGTTLVKCTINVSNGILQSCGNTGSFPGYFTGGLYINKAGSRLYVTLDSPYNQVYSCQISPTDGSLSSCASTGSGFSVPRAITFNKAETFAYIINSTPKTVGYCQVNASNGSLTNCNSNAAGRTFNSPLCMGTSPAGYIYVSDATGGAMEYCTSNSDGTLGNCQTTASVFTYPWGITFNYSGKIAYIANYSANNIMYCDVNTNGSLSNCNATASGATPTSGGSGYVFQPQ